MRKLQNDFERMIVMYKAPNGMVFEDYWAARKWSREQIQKEFDDLLKNNSGVCPKCGEVCFKSNVRGIFICRNCLRAFVPEEDEKNERKNTNKI